MKPPHDVYDPEAFRALGHRMIDRLADHLTANLSGKGEVIRWLDPEEMLRIWSEPFPAQGNGDVEPLIERFLRDSMHLHHPKYMGHQQAAAMPIAAIADLISSSISNSNGVYEMAPAGTIVEKRVVDWMSARLGFGSGSNGFFTSGGSLGNLTALLAARRQKCPDAWSKGRSDKLAVMVSEHAHYCVDRAARIMGWGEEGVIKIPTDANLRLDASRLEEGLRTARARDREVVAVVASSCNTAAGTFDPLDAIADFCSVHGLWLHVDGAHGASTVLSSRYRHLVKGIERADSVIWDAHKMLMMPALTTALLFREGDLSFETFAQEASYLFQKTAKEEWFNLCARTLETTKRNLAWRLFLALHAHGENVFGDIVTSRYDLARDLAELVTATEGFELGAEPESNIVCFRYRDSDPTAIRKKILARGKFYLVQTRLPGGIFLRTTLMNPFTNRADLAALLSEIQICATP